MDDLVERLQSLYVWPQSVADHHADVLTPRQIEKLYEVGNVAEQAIARIQALETSLAEAEGRVIAEVVAWCLREMYEPFTPLERAKALKSIATALETGEWRNAQSV